MIHKIPVEVKKNYEFSIEAETEEEALDLLQEQILTFEWDEVCADFGAVSQPYPEIVVDGNYLTGV